MKEWARVERADYRDPTVTQRASLSMGRMIVVYLLVVGGLVGGAGYVYWDEHIRCHYLPGEDCTTRPPNR